MLAEVQRDTHFRIWSTNEIVRTHGKQPLRLCNLLFEFYLETIGAGCDYELNKRWDSMDSIRGKSMLFRGFSFLNFLSVDGDTHMTAKIINS